MEEILKNFVSRLVLAHVALHKKSKVILNCLRFNRQKKWRFRLFFVKLLIFSYKLKFEWIIKIIENLRNK